MRRWFWGLCSWHAFGTASGWFAAAVVATAVAVAKFIDNSGMLHYVFVEHLNSIPAANFIDNSGML